MKFFLLVALFISTGAFAKNYRVSIQGMSCGSCAEKITKEFQKDKNVEKVQVDHEKGQMILMTKADLKEETIKKTIANMGYEVKSIEIFK